jgi:hypothetical protein
MKPPPQGFVRLGASASYDTSVFTLPPVPPARRTPGPWAPRVEIGGCDGLADVADFHQWLADSVAGEVVSYFHGPSLAAARLANPVLEELCRVLMLHSAGGSLFRVSPCFHVRGMFAGNGAVALTQRRVPAPPEALELGQDGAPDERAWWSLHLCRRLP